MFPSSMFGTAQPCRSRFQPEGPEAVGNGGGERRRAAVEGYPCGCSKCLASQSTASRSAGSSSVTTRQMIASDSA